MKHTILLGVLAVSSASVHASEFEILMKNKQFSQKQLTAKIGDKVNFKNGDPFSHNVFSLSDTKTFDLGSYPNGTSKSILLDKPGTIEVECAIHPGMKMTIEVRR